MSIKIMTLAWEATLSDSEKLILLALADWSNDDGVCWPSVPQLAKKCSKGERTVQAALKSLESAGHITRDQKIGRGCTYTVHPRSGCAPAGTAPVRRLRPAAAAPTPAAAAPNTSITPQASSEASPPTKPRKRADDTGTRLPEGWRPQKLSRDTVAGQIIEQRGQDWARRTLEIFENHWRSQTGKNGRKGDWQRTWANWVIEQDRRDGRNGTLQPHTGQGLRGSRPEPAVDMWRNAIAREAAEGAGGDREADSGAGLPLPSYLTN